MCYTAHRRRSNLFSRMLLEPLPPVSPPTAFVLCSSCKPLVGSLHRLIVRPVASAFTGGVDDASDVPTSPQDKACFATSKLCDAPGRFPRNDVVLLSSYGIDVLVNLPKIDRNPFQDNLIRLNEVVF